jgi:hypothetical protein
VAFTDVIDRKNVETVLVAKVEMRTVYGNPGSTQYFGDRYMEATVDGANRVISGVVKDWGGFGYLADFANFESVVSDCSLVLSVQDIIQGFTIGQNVLERFQAQEVIGARLTIFQLAKWAGTWESRQVWKGIVREPAEVSTDGITLSAVDLTPMQGLTPNVVISKVDFPNAPETSIGQPVPIVYGDHVGCAPPSKEGYAQMFGMNPRGGIPAVCIDDSKSAIYKAGKYLAMCHGAKAYQATIGTSLLLSGHRDRTGVVNTNWTMTNTPGAPGTGKLEIELDWPMTGCYVGAMPMGIATGNQASNPENAWDREYATTVSMTTGVGENKWLCATIPAVTPAGHIWTMAVNMWQVSCVPDDKIDFGLWDPTTSSWVDVQLGVGSAAEGGYTKTVLSGNQTWDASDYELRIKLLESAACTIRGIRLVFNYSPSASPIPYRFFHPPRAVKTFSGLDYGYDVAQYKRRAMAEGTVPAEVQVMANASGLQDDGSGTYTGTADALIEHAADQMHHIVGELSDLASTDIVGSSDHGSFTAARTALGTYHKLAPIILEQQPVNQMLHRLAFQSRSVPIWNADGKRGIITLTPTPSANYRSGSTFDFYADEHFDAKSFKFGRTALERVVNQVYVDFDFDYGTNEFRKTTFVTESNSDNGFGTRDQSAGREFYAGYSQGRFQVVRDFHMEAYDVVNQGVAKQLRNWIFDWWWRSKLWIEFETYLNASDLSVGHVIQLGDEVINGLTPTAPDNLYYTWDDFTWWVTGVHRIAGTGTTPRYRCGGSVLQGTRPQGQGHLRQDPRR